MQLYDYIDIIQLERHIESGLVSRQFHPQWPLAILNYTHEAMGKTYDDLVLRACRGLIYNFHTMEVIARPMRAFFNYNDSRYPETMPGIGLPEPTVYHEITEKIDGSLGILYEYGNNPVEIATRGSFQSEQAKWATNYFRLQSELGHGYTYFQIPEGMTVLVEIVYPENRIVVDYKRVQKLVLIAMIETATGAEPTWNTMKFRANACHMIPPLEIVPYYPRVEIAQCADENISNREGYVVKYFPSGPGWELKEPTRVKIKFEDYKLAHKAVFGMNNRSVWELLKDGKNIDFEEFKVCPKEFVCWLQTQVSQFTLYFNYIKQNVERLVDEARSHSSWTRKDLATFFNEQVLCSPLESNINLASTLFACYDGCDYKAMIWKILRPKHSTSFKNAIIEREVLLCYKLLQLVNSPLFSFNMNGFRNVKVLQSALQK